MPMSTDLMYKNNRIPDTIALSGDLKILEKKIWRSLFFEDEVFSAKDVLSRLYFAIITNGKARVICVLNKENSVVHTSFLIPKCYKFPFLKEKDYEIGPCRTNEAYRGRGIYPKVLNYILTKRPEPDSNYYMIIDENNISSRKGCEKAGFSIIGIAKRSAFLKIWHLERKSYE